MIDKEHLAARSHGSTRLARLAGLLLAMVFSPALATDVLVFAAASLKPALDTILETPAAQALGEVSVSYAATSQLARQIEHAAPASLFISADPEWMDHVEQRGHIVPGTRSNLLRNALVLVAPQSSTLELRIAPGFDLVGALGKDGRLAMGEPDNVPAGRYARAALVSLGVWASVESRIVPALHVRAALNFVARNEAPLGIVYRSDAVSEPRVRVIGTFAETTHPAIVYPAALLAGADNDASRRLLALLHSAQAAAIFTRYGFDVPSS
ncbi:molybdate ABC transporter substrate-binding protein [Dokdonella sp.]|uniref:molybdate ABC transporter substrate-binding protein n=1 Tax=Dokdonella sp. TaxID=2291710 RepID=UPI003529045C